MRLNHFRQRLKSAEPMKNDKKWGVYNRSTHAPITEEISLPLAKNTSYSFKAKAGIIANPIQAFGSPPSSNKPKEQDQLLYDQYLITRKRACKRILKLLKGTKIQANADNQYPCILVKTPLLPKLEDMSRYAEGYKENALISQQKCWSKLVASYFIAITNYLAFSQGIPVEIVAASGFGSLLPSVAECQQSIRINPGLTPKIYHQIIAQSIKQLYQFFNQAMLNHLKTEKIHIQYLNTHKEYNTQETTSFINIWEWLWSKADTGGKSVIYQIQRRNKVLEALTDYIFRQLIKNTELSVSERVAAIYELSKLFKISNGQLALLPNTHPHSKNWFRFPKHTHYLKKPYLKISDKAFWEMVKQLAESINASFSEIAHDKTLSNLYFKLDAAHQRFLKQAITTKAVIREPCSDSEYETDDEQPWFGLKVIAANGMRAINLARRTVELFCNAKISHKSIDSKFSYYEVPEAMKIVQYVTKIPSSRPSPITEHKVLFYDINYANVSHTKKPPIIKQQYTAIILDYTSAISTRVKNYLNEVKPLTNLILLVSSGTKNEQGGADLNAYGTLRIMTTQAQECKRLHNLLIKQEGAIHYNTSHQARRRYKNAGFVPQFKDLA